MCQRPPVLSVIERRTSKPLPDARYLRRRRQNYGSIRLAVNAKNFDFIKEDPGVDREFDLDVAGVHFIGPRFPRHAVCYPVPFHEFDRGSILCRWRRNGCQRAPGLTVR
ncbi:hypothetical protein ABES58_24395 [Paenibacillus lautus]|uniref:hypothetical protein n=1 Tax=Paenibacillus lautus TaxID=1401 RepID=UPI003D2B0689